MLRVGLCFVVVPSFMSLLPQMSMGGREKMAAEGVDPISGFAQKIPAFFVLVLRCSTCRSHVRLFRSRAGVIEGGVIAAMKIGVCLHIKMPGKKPAAIPQNDAEEVH